ncbi:MAG: thermopsin [Candidatus Thermoplasmatota archaeon]|nr:thermopsin [Candidatus Thermoplasmatota archaeon]
MKNVLVKRELFYSKIIVIVFLTVFLLVSVVPVSGRSDVGNVFGNVHQDHFNLINQHYTTSNVVPSSAYPIGSVPANSAKGSAVNPLSLYSREPAPMGIADYGIGPNGNPYKYNTTSFMGIVNIDSLSTYNSSLSYLNYTGGPHGMTFQLNINLQFFNGSSEYVYWVQDVADLNTSSNNIAFIDNVWNLSEPNANMHNSTVSGNGTVANSSGTHFYYDCATPSMSGNDVDLHYTAKVEFRIDSLITRNNQPEVAFMYNDGYGWITYDNVVFKFVDDLTADYGFVVNGYNYEPDGYTFYDAELILGGPGGGTQTNDSLSNLQLQLEYWNGHNFQQVVNAFNFGSDTAEGIHNVVSSGMYYKTNGTLFAQVANGNGSLTQIYNRANIGIINVSTNMSSGTLIINGTSYPFINCDINVTLVPGHYMWELYSSKGVLLAHGDFNLSAGQYLALNSAAIYTSTFTESGLQPGGMWYVNVTESNGTVYDSGAISGSSYSFLLTNGSYTYTIATSDKIYEPSPSSGSLTVDGSSPATIVVAFKEVTSFVTFTESGLPSGSTWYVNLSNGQTFSSTTGTISFSEPNGTYSYTIATSNNAYEPSTSSGSLSVNGAAVSKSVTFIKLYTITLTESNLPSGSTWYVNLSNGQKFSSTTGTISFSEPNGTFSYTISTSDHSYKPSVSSGSIKVDGSTISEPVNFVKLYTVAFTESGLPSGTSWSVTLNGTTLSSTTNTITFSLQNGTYSYTIGSISGYNISSSSGSISINGKNVTQSITFSSVPSTTPPPPKRASTPTSDTDLYIIIGAVAAVAVVGAVVAIMVRKRK